MSDALLTEISGKLSELITLQKKGGGASSGGATTPPKTTAGAAGAGAGKPKDTPAPGNTNKGAATGGAGKGAAASGPAAGTKAPGGKHTIEQVREVIRKVATNATLGKTSAQDILDSDGNGVKNVTELKPEFYDAVYEACTVLLNGEGKAAEQPAEDDLM